MIETLSGTVVSTSPHGVILRTGPVAWELFASARSIRKLNTHGNNAVEVYTHLIVREDDLRMYCFADSVERDVFRSLLSVSGIGPKQALKILSASDPGTVTGMIEAADIEALGRLPGIGKKTAQKMVLALQGQLVVQSGDPSLHDQFDEIIESLVSMGFERPSVRKVMDEQITLHQDEHRSARELETTLFRAVLMQLTAIESGG